MLGFNSGLTLVRADDGITTNAYNYPVTLLGAVSAAMAAFYQVTQELCVANQVTTFTMSDFSWTLQPNSDTGTDHPWGSHHIVMGGSVKGGKMYGTFPTLALGWAG